MVNYGYNIDIPTAVNIFWDSRGALTTVANWKPCDYPTMNRRTLNAIVHCVKVCVCYILIPCAAVIILLLSVYSFNIAVVSEVCHSSEGYRLVECDGDDFCCATNGKVECCATADLWWVWTFNAVIVTIIIVVFIVSYCDIRVIKYPILLVLSLVCPRLSCWNRRTPQILFPVQSIELLPHSGEGDLTRIETSNHPSSTCDINDNVDTPLLHTTNL